MKQRKLRDIAGEWPPGAWYRSYAHADKLTPDLGLATVASISISNNDVNLTINSNGAFSTSFLIADPDDRQRVLDVLSAAIGEQLLPLGDAEV